MSSRLLPIMPRNALRKLKRAEFFEHHQRGSHLVLKHIDGRMVVLPMHNRDLLWERYMQLLYIKQS